jgi:hypothetical protein
VNAVTPHRAGLSQDISRLRIVLQPAQLAALLQDEIVEAHEHGQASDGAVPIAAARFAGAVRVGSVDAGRVELMKHDVMSGTRADGARSTTSPIGIPDSALVDPADGVTSFSSTFTDILTAERALTLALRIRKPVIATWFRTAPKGRELSFDIEIGRVIGRGLLADASGVRSMTRITVQMTKEIYNGRPFFIAASRPIG